LNDAVSDEDDDEALNDAVSDEDDDEALPCLEVVRRHDDDSVLIIDLHLWLGVYYCQQ